MINHVTVPAPATLRQHASHLDCHASFMCWKRIGFALVLVSSSLLHAAAEAAITVNIEEVGSDVVASYSGSIDTTGIGFNLVSSSNSRRIAASGGTAIFAGPAVARAPLRDANPGRW